MAIYHSKSVAATFSFSIIAWFIFDNKFSGCRTQLTLKCTFKSVLTTLLLADIVIYDIIMKCKSVRDWKSVPATLSLAKIIRLQNPVSYNDGHKSLYGMNYYFFLRFKNKSIWNDTNNDTINWINIIMILWIVQGLDASRPVVPIHAVRLRLRWRVILLLKECWTIYQFHRYYFTTTYLLWTYLAVILNHYLPFTL